LLVVANWRICELSVRVAAAILAAVSGGILPLGSAGRMPGNTAGRDACRYRQLANVPASTCGSEPLLTRPPGQDMLPPWHGLKFSIFNFQSPI